MDLLLDPEMSVREGVVIAQRAREELMRRTFIRHVTFSTVLADVNLQTLDHGYTPLIMAAAHGQAQSWPCCALQPNELLSPDP